MSDPSDTIREGRPVIVLPAGGRRRRGGVLVLAAERATAKGIALLSARTVGGLVTVLPTPRLTELVPDGPARSVTTGGARTAIHVGVDALATIDGGSSSRDLARTARALASATTGTDDLLRPGHMMPVGASPGGVLDRLGNPEAALDVVRLSGGAEAATAGKLADESGAPPTRDDVLRLADELRVPTVTPEELLDRRLTSDDIVQEVASIRLPTVHAGFQCLAFSDGHANEVHLALVRHAAPVAAVPKVHIHRRCTAGDVMHSELCGCRELLEHALQGDDDGAAIVIYDAAAAPWSGESCGTPVSSSTRTSAPTADVGVLRHTFAGQVLRALGVSTCRMSTNGAGLDPTWPREAVGGPTANPWAGGTPRPAPTTGRS